MRDTLTQNTIRFVVCRSFAMGEQLFLVLVGQAGGKRRLQDSLQFDELTLFITNGRQGINLNKNTWHHFQIVLENTQDFIVIDRAGTGTNLEEIVVAGEVWIGDCPEVWMART